MTITVDTCENISTRKTQVQRLSLHTDVQLVMVVGDGSEDLNVMSMCTNLVSLTDLLIAIATSNLHRVAASCGQAGVYCVAYAYSGRQCCTSSVCLSVCLSHAYDLLEIGKQLKLHFTGDIMQDMSN